MPIMLLAGMFALLMAPAWGLPKVVAPPEPTWEVEHASSRAVGTTGVLGLDAVLELAARGEPALAEAALLEVLRKDPGVGGGASRGAAEALDRLAERLYTLGSLALVLQAREAALPLWERAVGREALEYVQSLLRLAASERDVDRVAAAHDHAIEALALIRQPAPSAESATAHLILASADRVLQDHRGARAHADLALEQRSALFGPHSLEVAEVALVLAKNASTERDAISSLRFAKAAEEILKDRPEVGALCAEAEEQVAAVLRAAGRWEEAMPYTLEALRVAQAADVRDRALYAGLWHAMGGYAMSAQQHPLALSLHERALRTLRLAGLEGTALHATVVSSIGAEYVALERYPEAIAARTAAVEIREKLFGPMTWSVGTALKGLATAQARAGRVQEARSNILRALQIHAAQARWMPDQVSEDVGIRWGEWNSAELNAALSILDQPEDVAALWNATLVWTGAVRGAAARRHLAAMGDPSREEELRRIQGLRMELAALAFRPESHTGDEAWSEQRERRLLELDGLERGLVRKFPEDLLGLREVSLEDICATLAPDVALVQIVAYRQGAIGGSLAARPRGASYLAFVVRGGQCALPQRVDLGLAAPIEEAATRWRGALDRFAEGDGLASQAHAKGRRLRELIWDPLGAALSGVGRVYLVPDGALQGVPLVALPLSDGRYLVEQTALSTLDSARDIAWWAISPAPSGQRALVVSAAPGRAQGRHARADARAPMDGCVPDGTDPLPGARREAARVARLLSRSGASVERAAGASATEAFLNARAPGASILHIAAHGYWPQAGCGSDEDPGIAGGRAGLVVASPRAAGAEPAEDGLWSAAEIQALDLRSARLVVLSACGSALGELQGVDGMVGLRRAFAIAGARSVVSTLGPVPDRSGTRLMERFYRALGETGAPADAMASAQRAEIAAQRAAGVIDPHAWALFTVMGAWAERSGAAP